MGCGKILLTPWPGHKEECNGFSHAYFEMHNSLLENNKLVKVRISPSDKGIKLEGIFACKCPLYVFPSDNLGVGGVPRWEIDKDNSERMDLEHELDTKIFIPDKWKKFANFDIEYNNQANDVDDIKEFVLNKNSKRLTLKGSVGLGKTHLAQAAYWFALENSIPSRIISSRHLYDIFRELEGFDYDTIYHRALKRMWKTSLIIIDDLGVEKQRDNQVFNVNLMELLDEFSGKIIVTTNLGREDMDKVYGEKIVSRLYNDAIVILLKGKDYRANPLPKKFEEMELEEMRERILAKPEPTPMTCTLAKEKHYAFTDETGRDIWDRLDSFQEFRINVFHARTMKRFSKIPFNEKEKRTYDFCSGKYHTRYYGEVPGDPDRSYTDGVIGLCPDFVKHNQDESRASAFGNHKSVVDIIGAAME
jgi:DNA replication protein DnaC